jgi:hypothetical protein
MAAKYYILLILLCGLSIISRGQDNNIFIQKLIDEGKVIKAVQEWNADENPLLFVYYSSDSSDAVDGLPFPVFSFYQRDSTGNFQEIYRDSIGDGLVGFYQTSEYQGNLITIWIAGSAYHFKVFSYVNGTVHLVQEAGSKVMPELVKPDFRSEYKIIYTHIRMDIDEKTGNGDFVPCGTEIYTWKKDHYEEIDVPYRNRYNFYKKK